MYVHACLLLYYAHIDSSISQYLHKMWLLMPSRLPWLRNLSTTRGAIYKFHFNDRKP